jgi:hypothetical protein
MDSKLSRADFTKDPSTDAGLTVENIATLFSSLSRLRSAWSLTPRAKGGMLALAGFEFQLTKALHDVIRAGPAAHPQVFIEALSDIVRRENGFVIAQLKRTLSSSSFHSALEELWSIEELARRETSDLIPHLRYEVQSARRGLQNIADSLDRWKPDGQPDADRNALLAFKQRVSVSFPQGTRLEAARLLVQTYKDPKPFITLDLYLGRLLRAAETEAFDQVVEELGLELEALQLAAASHQQRFGLWGADDQPPAAVVLDSNVRTAVRVGQRLTREDLKEGRLVDRRVYGDLHDNAEAWLANLDPASEKIPTLWIQGRSGSGKSAALLHLLAKLQAKDPERAILWLGSDPEIVGDAVAWASALVREGRQVIVAMDDPVAPERQQSFLASSHAAAEEWNRIRRMSPLLGADGLLPPIFVCCGPTEQREFAEDECFADIQITALELPPETREDVTELANWYAQRTGRRVPILEGDVLLVQRFFEWNEGSLRDFALRFRRRLEGFDRGATKPVFDTIATVLAFGRLYAEYPADVLRERLRDDANLARAFDQLALSESHFAFTADGSMGGGFRLTHPHLADGIYREWFSRPADRHYRARHLRDGLAAALSRLESDPGIRFAPLWAIGRLLHDRDQYGRLIADDLRRRVDLVRPELTELLPEIYQRLLPGATLLSDIPVWIGLDAELGLELDPSPYHILIDEVSRTDGPAKGLRLSCHKLLMHQENADQRTGSAVVANLLTRLTDYRDAGMPWHEWPPIAADLIRRGDGACITDAVLKMVESSPTWPRLGVVVLQFVREGPAAAIETVASAWMARAPVTAPEWPRVLLGLRERTPESSKIKKFADAFLNKRIHDRLWPLVWDRMTGGVHDADLCLQGLAWLGLRPTEGIQPIDPEVADFGKVWSRLLELAEGGAREELVRYGIANIQIAASELDGWSFLWRGLWEVTTAKSSDRAKLLDVGRQWLVTSPYHHGWSFVWHGLIADPGSDLQELADLAEQWLRDGDANHSGWEFVWEKAIDLNLANPEASARLLLIGLRWLRRAGKNHKGWGYVWTTLIADERADRTDLTQLGLAWLQVVEMRHGSWRHVAHELLKLLQPSDPDRAVVISLVAQWLQAFAGDQHWAQLFNDVSSELEPAERSTLRDIAVAALLGEQLDDSAWAAMFKAIAHDEEVATTLLARIHKSGFRRLGERSWTTNGWSSTYLALTTHLHLNPEIGDGLKQLADDTLAVAPFDEFAWPRLWLNRLAVFPETAPTAKELVRLAHQWLEQAEPANSIWFHVWWRIARLTSVPDSPEIINATEAWLRRPILRPDHWVTVWKRHPNRKGSLGRDEVIVARATEWLGSSKLDAGNWSLVWTFVFLNSPSGSSAQLLDLAHKWLAHTEVGHPGWPYVWDRTRRVSATAASAHLSKALAWLGDRKVHSPNWFETWRTASALEIESLPEPVIAAQAQWLARAGAHPSLPLVVRATMKANRAVLANPQCVQALKTWLESNTGRHAMWTLVWGEALSASRKTPAHNQLITMGIEWLRGDNGPHKGWSRMFSGLWNAAPSLRPELARLGPDWLGGAGLGNVGTEKVRELLKRHTHGK